MELWGALLGGCVAGFVLMLLGFRQAAREHARGRRDLLRQVLRELRDNRCHCAGLLPSPDPCSSCRLADDLEDWEARGIL